MQISEIRNLSADELKGRILTVREELATLRFKAASGQVSDTSLLGKTRKTIARLLTVARERALHPEEVVEHASHEEHAEKAQVSATAKAAKPATKHAKGKSAPKKVAKTASSAKAKKSSKSASAKHGSSAAKKKSKKK